MGMVSNRSKSLYREEEEDDKALSPSGEDIEPNHSK